MRGSGACSPVLFPTYRGAGIEAPGPVPHYFFLGIHRRGEKERANWNGEGGLERGRKERANWKGEHELERAVE